MVVAFIVVVFVSVVKAQFHGPEDHTSRPVKAGLLYNRHTWSNSLALLTSSAKVTGAGDKPSNF